MEVGLLALLLGEGLIGHESWRALPVLLLLLQLLVVGVFFLNQSVQGWLWQEIESVTLALAEPKHCLRDIFHRWLNLLRLPTSHRYLLSAITDLSAILAHVSSRDKVEDGPRLSRELSLKV